MKTVEKENSGVVHEREVLENNMEGKIIINKISLEIIKGLIVGYSANQKHSTLVEILSHINRLIDEH